MSLVFIIVFLVNRDITTLGKEFRLETKDNTTYPTPFILSDDPHHISLLEGNSVASNDSTINDAR